MGGSEKVVILGIRMRRLQSIQLYRSRGFSRIADIYLFFTYKGSSEETEPKTPRKQG